MKTRVALLSLHSSPLARIGTTDAGGMNIFVARLAHELRRFGVETDVFTRRSSPDMPRIAITDRGIRVIHLDAGPSRMLPKAALPQLLPAMQTALNDFMREDSEAYDLIHSHYWVSGAVGLDSAGSMSLPLVHMSHTLMKVKEMYTGRHDARDSALRFEGERRVLEQASAVVVATDDELQHIRKLYALEPKMHATIPAGVDVNVFRPLDGDLCRRELGIEAERVLLFVGRMDPIKGIDTLLHSFAALSPHARNGLKLVMVGDSSQPDSPMLVQYRKLARALGLKDAVEFRDLVPHDELAAYYAAADICAVPSAYETFGMVAVESMACGTPVVAFRTGGLSSLIHDGITGFLAAPGNRKAYSQKLELALNHADLDRIGQQARAAVQQYTWPRIAGLTRHLYARVLDPVHSCAANR